MDDQIVDRFLGGDACYEIAQDLDVDLPEVEEVIREYIKDLTRFI
jgi:hypothetical protein|tara:strand:- start:3477 stop:3611 length:135 start_codon:yes stop_codon:yes gene_type:complete